MSGRRRRRSGRGTRTGETRAAGDAPASLRLLARLCAAVDDALLLDIARADHGIDAERHRDALREIRDSLTLSSIPLWHPGEVLELERWSGPSRPGPGGDETRRRAHLARAFACAALLAAACDERVGYAPDGENQTLARLLDSLIALDDPVLEIDALAFVRHRLDDEFDDASERAFFLLARLLLCVRTSKVADLPGTCLLARRVVAEEAAARRALRSCPRPPAWVDDAPWLVGLTRFDQSVPTWRVLGEDLEAAARLRLTGQARVEVVALARRLRA